jgi:hypothetical protein
MTTGALRTLDDVEVITIRLASDDNEPALTWVADPVCEVVERCQSGTARAGCRRLIISLLTPAANSPSRQAIADAAVAALRGLVHSLTLEVGRAIALNLVIAQAIQEAVAAETVAFLAGDAATWIQGATFDLRKDPWQQS